MGRNDAERAIILAKVRDDSTAVTVPGQIHKRDTVNLDPGSAEQNNAKKPVAGFPPTARRVTMGVLQAALGLKIGDIQNTGMRRSFFVGLLQHQNVGGSHDHLTAQHICRADRVDLAILTAPAMNVPRCNRQMCQGSIQDLAQGKLNGRYRLQDCGESHSRNTG